jgi:hypothetical protein
MLGKLGYQEVVPPSLSFGFFSLEPGQVALVMIIKVILHLHIRMKDEMPCTPSLAPYRLHAGQQHSFRWP